MPALRPVATCFALSLLLTPAFAADQKPAPARAEAAAAASLDNTALQGTVIETMNAAGYTYLQVEGAAGRVWVAIPESTVTKGQQVTLPAGHGHGELPSQDPGPHLPTIVFSPGLQPAAAGAAWSPIPAAAGGDKAAGDFSAALQAEAAATPAGGGAQRAGTQGRIRRQPRRHRALGRCQRAQGSPGQNSRSVGECFAQAKELNGTKVRVRGKVMKVSRLIMGKNWLHLQDGTGNPMQNRHDLVVTTLDEPKEGEVVTIEGVLAANRDFGAGYKYEVIVEDARVEK